MKTKNNGERLVPGQKDTYRRSEMVESVKWCKKQR